MRLTTRPTMTLPLLALLTASTTGCLAPVGPDDPTPQDRSCTIKSAHKVTTDLTIRSAADWDDVPSGCWDLAGKLTLQGDAVTSLANLDKLVGIDQLVITDTKLTELDVPLYVYESVSISGNDLLTSLDQLTVDSSSAVDVSVDDNAELVDLGGLADLEQVTGNLTISRNAKLPALELGQLVAIAGSTRISNNAALATIDLGKLDTLHRLEVLDNAALATIEAFPARTIDGDVTIRGNAKLTTLGTMSSLDSIAGSLTIDNNASLTTIGMFTTSMRYVSTLLTISNNPQLTSLGQLSHLQIIGGVAVTGNSKLPFCRAQEINHCVPQHGAVSITGNLNDTTNCSCWCE